MKDPRFEAFAAAVRENLKPLFGQPVDPERWVSEMRSVLGDLAARRPWEEDQHTSVLSVEEVSLDTIRVTVSVPRWLGRELGLFDIEDKDKGEVAEPS